MDTHVGFPSPVDATTEHGVVLGRPNEFVDVALAAGRYFQDALPIVGRAEELQTLVNFIETPCTARVVVLVGRAGSGKTSLLAALAETLSQRNVTQAVRFASDVASVAAPHAPRLPKGPSVIVIDDAHRKPCTAALLHAAQHRPEVAFVLTTRPGGLSRLVALCSERGLSEAEIRVLPEIGPLSPDDAERSARHVLDEEFGAHAKQLAAISAGHPQLVSIAGRLVREKALHPVALEQPADFGARVLARGYETLLMRASVTPDQKLFGGVLGQVTDMLGIVAALAPVRTSDERFLQGAGELLGCRRRDLVSALRALETTGIIERSAPGARVVPTALADHALLRLFTAPLPLPGTLAERVSVIVRHFGIHALVPLFRNLGEMDGPSIPPGSASKFVAELFEYCRDALDAASTMDRCRLLSSLREVCVDEPAGMLELVEFALGLPPLTDTAPKSRVLLSETSVTNELSPILQRIALHRQHLPEAVDSLWALGRDDVRLQSPHPDHPMRVLREFASRAHTLPVGFHEALLDAVERWQMVPHAHDHQHSPLDVLDTFLAESDAPISDDALAGRQRRLRTRALESLARAAGSPNRRAALAGVRGLEGVLTDMATHSSAGFPEADWRDGERLEVIEMLRKTATSAADPVVHFAVADVFRWAAHRTPNDTICIAAELALADVPDSSERRLYEALTQRPPAQRAGLDLDAPPSSRLLPDARNNEPRGAEMARIVIDEWMAKGPLPAAFVQQTAEALDTLSLAGKSGSPRVLLQVLSLKNPEAAAKACEVIMQSPDGPLGPHIAALLHTLRESAPERATDLVQNIVTGRNATLCASLAQAFPRWVDKPRNGDREALRALLGHPDGFVRRAALGVLRTLAKTAPHDAVALAVEVDLSEGAEAVETLFAALDGGKLFVGDALSVEEIVAFLSRLSAATNLEGHSTIRFLHVAGKRLPEETALLLIERIERLVGPGVLAIENFVALPSEGLGSILARLPESPEWVAILRRIRQLARSRSNVVRTQAARLFQAASKNYSPVAMDVLSEWLEAARAEELEAVSALLEEAPASLLFSHVNLVATLLRNSHALGGALFDTVQNALLPVAMGPGRMRGIGPQMTDAALRTQAREAAAKLAPRSPERRFFEAIVKHTETLIAEETAAEHDDLFDL